MLFDQDPSYFRNVKKDNIRVSVKKRGDYENFEVYLVGDDGAKAGMLYVTTPPVTVVKPKLTMEGKLGETINGTLSNDRAKAVFGVGIVPPRATEEIKRAEPDYEKNGRDLFVANREFELCIVEKLFELEGSAQVDKVRQIAIDQAKKERKIEVNVGNRSNGLPPVTESDIGKKMETDETEREIVMTAAKELFIENAGLSVDPFNYDSDGNLLDGREGKKKLALWPERKVWPRSRESIDKGVKPEPVSSYTTLNSTVDNWAKIVEEMLHYKYNETVYKNPDGTTIPRPQFTYTTANGVQKTVGDPSWTVLKNELVSTCTLTLRYGITFNKESTKLYVKPFLTTKITIINQELRKEHEAPQYSKAVATGVYRGDVPKDVDEPAGKRQKTEPASVGFQPDEYDDV